MDVMTENKLVPKLRFAEFENERETNSYKKHSFTDVFLFSSGKNIKQNEASPEFETPCVRYGELYHMYNEVIYEIINRTNLEKSELLFSQGDEILLPSAGEDPLDIGSASALTIKDVAIGRTINVLRPKSDDVYSQKYASYYINQKLRKQISRLAKGVSISNVYNSDLKKLKIILPSLKEQRKVDSFLSAVDDKLQQLKKKKELLEEYKKGVMQKIFSQELRFKDDNGNSFPDWEKKKIKEKYIVLNPERVDAGYTPYLEIGDINPSLHNYIFKDKKTVQGALKVPKNTLLISTVRPKLNKIVITREDINVSGAFATIKISNTFLFHLMTTITINNKLVRYSEGGTYPTINKKTIYSLKLLFPSTVEERKIANFLSSLDSKIALVSTQIENTKSFKKGLLQQMFV